MRHAAFRLALTISLLIPALSACMGSPKAVPQANKDAVPLAEELITEVPRQFSDAKKWNKADICPEGSELTPFTRYRYETGQKTHGFKHYFGRSCAIVRPQESETLMRRLASVTDSRPTITSAKLVPHGPFIWWYENGRRMEVGSFDNGTMSIELNRYEPDGSLAVKD